ncbi:MAG: hypothetical protein OXD33_10255 [Rhodobacteraceae bacterium]|nr:hypothetical protein [Paracoccaceae bacterium]
MTTNTVIIGHGLDVGDNFGLLGLLDPGFDGIGVGDACDAHAVRDLAGSARFELAGEEAAHFGRACVSVVQN